MVEIITIPSSENKNSGNVTPVGKIWTAQQPEKRPVAPKTEIRQVTPKTDIRPRTPKTEIPQVTPRTDIRPQTPTISQPETITEIARVTPQATTKKSNESSSLEHRVEEERLRGLILREMGNTIQQVRVRIQAGKANIHVASRQGNQADQIAERIMSIPALEAYDVNLELEVPR